MMVQMRRLAVAGMCAAAGLFFMAGCDLLGPMDPGSGSTSADFTVRIEVINPAVVISPGAYVVHMDDGPLFMSGAAASAGLESVAEDGNPGGLAAAGAMAFLIPEGMDGPAVVHAGEAYVLNFTADEGSSLSFVTMFVQSNDLFYAPNEQGIALFDDHGAPVSGDVTDQIALWDAGTEVNEEPGMGPNQAPRQAAANTGDDENGVVHMVNDGYMYPAVDEAIRVTISSN